jgi:hypothetical protein
LSTKEQKVRKVVGTLVYLDFFAVYLGAVKVMLMFSSCTDERTLTGERRLGDILKMSLLAG